MNFCGVAGICGQGESAHKIFQLSDWPAWSNLGTQIYCTGQWWRLPSYKLCIFQYILMCIFVFLSCILSVSLLRDISNCSRTAECIVVVSATVPIEPLPQFMGAVLLHCNINQRKKGKKTRHGQMQSTFLRLVATAV